MSEEDDHNDIDSLMAIDPLELTKQDLSRIVAYQRKQRAMREQGVKPKKAKGEVPAAVSIENLLMSLPSAKPKPPGTSIRRR